MVAIVDRRLKVKHFKMPRPLTLVEKAQIVLKIEEGWSIRALAQFYGRNESTVLEIKKRWEQEGSLKRKEGSGRPRISSPEEDAMLLEHLRDHPFEIARKAINITGFPGSRSTASRRINGSELKNRVAAKKLN